MLTLEVLPEEKIYFTLPDGRAAFVAFKNCHHDGRVIKKIKMSFDFPRDVRIDRKPPSQKAVEK